MRGEPAYKPGSVEGNHSSGIHVAVDLKQPTRKRARISAALVVLPTELLPYLALLQVGFTMPALLPRPRCALTAPFHPYRPPRLAPWKLRRFAFCCTFRGLAPPRRYLAPDPPEPGLSSIPRLAAKNSDHLADSQGGLSHAPARVPLASRRLRGQKGAGRRVRRKINLLRRS